MIYTEEDLRRMGIEEDVHVPDKSEDVNPVAWGREKVNFYFFCWAK
jgi:hypothetical protein